MLMREWFLLFKIGAILIFFYQWHKLKLVIGNMYDNYNYPIGADTPHAPWNEQEVPERCFDVLISQTLSKTTVVSTRDYIPEYEEEDGHTYADTSETDWEKAYSHSGHYTPLELISEFKKFLTKHLPDPIVDVRGFREAKDLIAECEGWLEDETIVIKN